MAGSLCHIIDQDGHFTMDLIENLGDAHEALEECFGIILMLSGGDMGRVSAICKVLHLPDPYAIHRCKDDPMPKSMRFDE